MNAKQQSQVRVLIKTKTVPEIAERLDIAQQRIYRFCKRNDIKICRATGRLPPDIQSIYDMIAELGSVEKVATHFGVTRQAVYYRCKRGK